MGVINKTTEKINELLDKVEESPEGLIEFDIVAGEVQTLPANSNATVDIDKVFDGVKYVYTISFGIPKGKDGTTTDTEGNPVSIDWDSVLNKPDWIDSPTKPTYSANEVGALPADTAFKTINGQSIIGEGEITIQGGSGSGGVGQNYSGYKNAEIFNDYENNIAAGAHAHAEGRETNATGPRAHAEGYLAKVYAAEGHAEGRETWCVGNQSHAEGLYSIAWGGSSHIEGSAEKTFDVETRLLNNEELIRDFLGSFTKGVTINNEYFSKIDFDVLDSYIYHIALGISSHAEGVNNIVCDKAGHVEGYKNICGDIIPGMGAESASYAPHVEGLKNRTASRLYGIHVGGGFNEIKSGNYAFAHGYNLSVENDYETAFGKWNTSVINGKKVLFSYGIGTSSNTRKNALSIFEDGSVEIPQFSSERLELAISNSEKVSALITEMQSSLFAEINALKEEVKALYEYIINNPGGGGQTGKAYVIGITLIFNESENINVSNESLIIIDSEIRVENETLKI